MSSRHVALLSVFSLALAAAPSAVADVLVLQDGERIRGRLLSVNRGWVEFQASEDDLADPLRFAVAEVRAIRFGDEAEGALTGPALRGGGDVLDEEERPARLGDRRRRREEVGETETAPPTRRVRMARRRDRMITVSATERWTDTGIDVAAGDVVTFSVAGTVTVGDDRPLGPEGDLDDATAAPRRPLPDRPAGALIGRIGTSPDDTFFIGGERLPFRVRTSGRLYLGINDDEISDDDGAFQVAVGR